MKDEGKMMKGGGGRRSKGRGRISETAAGTDGSMGWSAIRGGNGVRLSGKRADEDGRWSMARGRLETRNIQQPTSKVEHPMWEEYDGTELWE